MLPLTSLSKFSENISAKMYGVYKELVQSGINAEA
jgi:hypothetical protein